MDERTPRPLDDRDAEAAAAGGAASATVSTARVPDTRPPLRIAAPRVFEAAAQLARQTEEGQRFGTDEMLRMLGYRARSGASIGVLNAMRRMRLVKGRERAMCVTPLGRRLVSDVPGEAARARLEAVANDEFVAAFVARYRGRELPDTQRLAAEMEAEMGVRADRPGNVAAQTVRTLRAAGMLRDGVVLDFDEAARALGPAAPASAAAVTQGLRPEVAAVLDAAVSMLPTGSEPWDEEGLERWLGLLRPGLAWAYKVPLSRPREPAAPDG